MRENNRNSIEKCRKKLSQFTTMNVIDGQADLIIYISLIFYSLTLDNILNIIILLILAGVSIATLTGENGLLTKANTAKERATQEEEKEQIKLAYNATRTEKLGNGDTSVVVASELQKELDNQNAGTQSVDERNKIKVTFTKSENTYIIDSVGTVKNESEVKEKVIQFKIDNLTFTANEGDTWLDWLYDIKDGIHSDHGITEDGEESEYGILDNGLLDGFLNNYVWACEHRGGEDAAKKEGIFCHLTGMASGAYFYYSDDDGTMVDVCYGDVILEGIDYELYAS